MEMHLVSRHLSQTDEEHPAPAMLQLFTVGRCTIIQLRPPADQAGDRKQFASGSWPYWYISWKRAFFRKVIPLSAIRRTDVKVHPALCDWSLPSAKPGAGSLWSDSRNYVRESWQQPAHPLSEVISPSRCTQSL